MKNLNHYLSDESPKMQKKLEKMLENNDSAMYLEALKQELRAGGEVENTGIGLCVTNSYFCAFKFGIGATISIIPITSISNIYRTNVADEYLYDAFFLAVETTNGAKRLFSRYPRTNAKSLDIYKPIIDAVKSRLAAWQGGQQ